MKPKIESKTLWFNALCLCLLLLLATAQQLSFIKPNADAVLMIGAVMGCINIVLRLLTTQPVK